MPIRLLPIQNVLMLLCGLYRLLWRVLMLIYLLPEWCTCFEGCAQSHWSKRGFEGSCCCGDEWPWQWAPGEVSWRGTYWNSSCTWCDWTLDDTMRSATWPCTGYLMSSGYISLTNIKFIEVLTVPTPSFDFFFLGEGGRCPFKCTVFRIKLLFCLVWEIMLSELH